MLIMQIKDFSIYLFEHTVFIFSGISMKEQLPTIHCTLYCFKMAAGECFFVYKITGSRSADFTQCSLNSKNAANF